MPKQTGTVGQLLLRHILPPDIWRDNLVLDKAGVAAVLAEVATKHPDKYREISFHLNQLGKDVAYRTGGNSFGLRHLLQARAAAARRQALGQQMKAVLDDDKLSDDEREKALLRLTGEIFSKERDEIFVESREENNPLAKQLLGAGRGNKMNLASLRGSDGLYADHRGRTIPIPVLRSYAQGLSPAEYWASTYGARQGVLATKLAVADAGFFCLHPSTLVRMADQSEQPISQIRAGEYVLGADKDGNTFPTRVTATFYNGLRELHRFLFELAGTQFELVATAQHRLLAFVREEWQVTALVSLCADQRVACAPDSMVCRFVGSEPLGVDETHDIEVAHSDRLFVLANGLIVSNSKQLAQLAHRLVVTDVDRDGEPETVLGLPTDVDDPDNEGSLLAKNMGGYPKNTVLTPKIIADLRAKGVQRLLVRSPVVSGSPDGGVYARDVGLREFGRLPARGEAVGITAAQSIGEQLAQSQLSLKHTGGVAGEAKSLTGFAAINAMVQVPKVFQGAASHAEVDGHVQAVTEAPAGGNYVVVEGKRHYVAAGFPVTVKVGDAVEAGDVLSEGIPNPAAITKYKGIGEGRRYFLKTFAKTLKDSGISTHRRNLELIARGLINHVRLTDEIGDFAPDDVVPYSTLEHSYRPRQGANKVRPQQAIGQYLERPYLHYTIGSKVRPSMLRDFDEFGVGEVEVHRDPPPFEDEMVRGMANLHHDPEWLPRLFGSGLKSSLLDSVHRGSTTTELGTSFVPGRAKAVDFGRVGILQTQPRGPSYGPVSSDNS